MKFLEASDMCPSGSSSQSGAKVETDVEYAVHDGVRLTGTLYRPKNQASSPVVVAVHGGGWKSGTSERYRHWGHWLANRGFALFAIEYRLASEARFPACLFDVTAAVQFVHASAERYGLDPERIGLIGDSAGAHLACLAALANGSTQLLKHNNAFQPPIRAVVSIYGVYDLFAQWEHDQVCRPRDQITEGLMGFSPLEDKVAYFQASPIAYTNTKVPRTSFMIAWGTDDDVVDCASQSVRFAKELKQSGQFVRPVPIVGAPHFWIDQPIEEDGSFTRFLAPKLLRFLNDKLGHGRETR
jgi:acetyl esterase/lipase